jgi:hypothetical protein
VPAVAEDIIRVSTKVDIPSLLAGVLPGLSIDATAGALVNALKDSLLVSVIQSTIFLIKTLTE